MDLHKIEEKILAVSPYVKEIFVCIHDGALFALIHPDLEALKDANIINIKEEIRWYAVELYNMKAKEEEKVRGFMVSKDELPKLESGLFDITAINRIVNEQGMTKQEFIEPNNEIYKALKSYISNFSKAEVTPDSHLELDLGLDSLDYVELFVFIQNSFGVYIDEKIFSSNMKMSDLFLYVKEHLVHFDTVDVKWRDILNETDAEELIYSPFIMYTYKTLLLPLFKLYFSFEIKGKENIPSSQCIFAPSHQSMLDGFLLEASLPYPVLKKTFFLAFEQVFGTSLMRPVARHGQSILIDANNNLKLSMQKTAQPLKEGNNVVIFPEGARTRDRKLLEFRPFFAMLSQEYDVPVVPVVIDGSFEALQSGKIFPRPKKIRLTFLKPVYPKNMGTHEIAKRTKEAIQEEMNKNPL